MANLLQRVLEDIDKNIQEVFRQITASGGNPDNSQALLALYDQRFRLTQGLLGEPHPSKRRKHGVCFASFVYLFTDVYSALYVGGSI